MRIGELARRAGLRTSAIRYYETIGILKVPARVSGRREYDAEALDALQLVQAAREAGFTLNETRQLIADLHEPSPRAWQTMVRRKLIELNAAMARLGRARDVLLNAMDCSCAGRADACKLVGRGSKERGERRVDRRT
ncbi:MerR family transcriptional regulator [Pendulispora brunnea]|uniref:MerR family transcriptional regulator n=1 Tax=Pendulispora brunnea TaxID=2905690 RepID=A0ABZ2KBR2_9BACT